MSDEIARLGLVVDADGFVRADKAMSDFNRTAGASEKSMFSLANAVRAAITGATVKQVIDYADRWSDLNSKLVNATGSQAAADAAMQGLSQTARTTYSSLEATANAFLRNSQTLKELGYSTEAQINLSDALNNSLVISGTKGQQAESVMNALSKAMAFGELRGENFNSVIENGGRTVQALADGLGVGTLELRKMAEAGELKTAKVIDALTSQMQLLREEAEAMPATVGDGFVLLGNAMLEYVGRADQALGITGSLSAGIIDAADAMRDAASSTFGLQYNIDQIQAVMDAAVSAGEAMAVIFGARLASSIAAATTATLSNVAATLTATTTVNVWGQRVVTATGLQNAMAASAGVLSKSLALVGGPVGAAMIAAYGIWKLYDAVTTTTKELEEMHRALGSMGRDSVLKAMAEEAERLNKASDGLYARYKRLGEMQNRSPQAEQEFQKLAVQIAEAEKRLRDYQSALNRLDNEAFEKALADMTEGYIAFNGVAAKTPPILEETSEKALNLVDALQNQIKAFGMSAREQAIFKAELDALNAGSLPETVEKVKALAAQLYDMEEAATAATEAQALSAEIQKELTKEYEASVDAINDETSALVEKTAQMRFETQTVGMTEQAIFQLELARFDNVTAMQAEQLAMLDSIGICTAETEALRASIAARSEYRAAMVDQSAVNIRRAQIEAEEKAMVDMWTNIDNAARDAFVSILDGGRDAFERLEDSLKSGLYALLYEMTVKKWIINIAANVSGGSVGGQLGSSATNGLLNNLGGASGILSGITGAGSVLSTSGAVISAAEYAQLMGGASVGAGGAAGAGLAAGLKGAMAAIPGWGWAAMAAAAAAALLSKESTPSHNAGLLLESLPGVKGQFQTEAFASGLTPVGFSRRTSQAEAEQIISLFRDIDAAFTAAARAADIEVNLSRANFTGLAETGLGSGLFLGSAGEKGKPGMDLGQQLDTFALQLVESIKGSLSAEDYNAIITAGGADQIIAKMEEVLGATADAAEASAELAEQERERIEAAVELQSSLFDRYATDAAKVDQAINQIVAAFDGLGIAIPGSIADLHALAQSLDPLTEEGQNALEVIDSLAGAIDIASAARQAEIDAINTSTQLRQSLADQYATDDQLVAQAREQIVSVFTALDMWVPQTTQELRELVLTLDPLTEEGRAAISAIDGLSGAIGVVTSASEKAAQDMADAAKKIADTERELERNRQALRDQIAVLSGEITQEEMSRQNALAEVTDAATIELMKTVYAMQDAARAAEEMKRQEDDLAAQRRQAAEEARHAEDEYRAAERALAQSIYQERYALETKLLQLQGDTAALRQRELDTMYSANHELQQLIWSMEDMADAAKAAEQAEQAAAQAEAEREAKRQAILSERAGLENQLWQLLGNTAAIRERELAALDPSNRALQQQIWAIEDQAKALSDMAASASRLRSVADSLLGAVTSLTLSNLSPLTNAQRFDAAQSEFARLQVLAEQGDESALSSVEAAARAYLTEAQRQFASSSAYTAIFEDVTEYLSDLGQSLSGQAVSQESQLQQLQQQQLSQLQQANTTAQSQANTLVEIRDGLSRMMQMQSAAAMHQEAIARQQLAAAERAARAREQVQVA